MEVCKFYLCFVTSSFHASRSRNDELLAAKKKIEFYNALLEARNKNVLIEKYAAIQLVSSTGNNDEVDSKQIFPQTKNIKLNQMNMCEKEIREKLLSREDSSESGSTMIGLEKKNMDDIVKYHEMLQEKVTNDMVHLVQTFKSNMQVSNHIVKKDNEVSCLFWKFRLVSYFPSSFFVVTSSWKRPTNSRTKHSPI